MAVPDIPVEEVRSPAAACTGVADIGRMAPEAGRTEMVEPVDLALEPELQKPSSRCAERGHPGRLRNNSSMKLPNKLSSGS